MPMFTPYLLQASRRAWRTSVWFEQPALATSVVLSGLSQRQKPSWCLAVMMISPKPLSRAVFTHWSASMAVGL